MKSIDFRKLLPKGSVLVFSLLILSIMLVTSLTILSSAVLDRKASLSTGSSARSFQVADSGVEEVLYEIYKGTGNSTLSVLAGKIPGAVCNAGKISFPVAGGEAVVGFYQDETTIYADGCGGTDDAGGGGGGICLSGWNIRYWDKLHRNERDFICYHSLR